MGASVSKNNSESKKVILKKKKRKSAKSKRKNHNNNNKKSRSKVDQLQINGRGGSRSDSTLWDEGQPLNVFVCRIQKPDFSM